MIFIAFLEKDRLHHNVVEYKLLWHTFWVCLNFFFSFSHTVQYISPILQFTSCKFYLWHVCLIFGWLPLCAQIRPPPLKCQAPYPLHFPLLSTTIQAGTEGFFPALCRTGPWVTCAFWGVEHPTCPLVLTMLVDLHARVCTQEGFSHK